MSIRKERIKSGCSIPCLALFLHGINEIWVYPARCEGVPYKGTVSVRIP
jgi:hypothetical protein